MLILRITFGGLRDHINSVGKDPRINDLPLLKSYGTLVLIMGLYILFVMKIGPQFMANRKPYNVKRLIQIYNIFQIVMNLYMFIGVFKWYLNNPNYSWICIKYDPTDVTPVTMNFRHFAYLYYINKILDFLDTVFFILRKKNSQVTFLHVYHHAMMVYGCFVYLNLFFGSQFTIIGLVNSFVHFLMYIYYLLSSLDTKINLEPWKPFMTQIQIVQFFYFSVKFLATLINNSRCGLSYTFLWMLLIQNTFMTAMFSHFYWNAYIVKRRKKIAKE